MTIGIRWHWADSTPLHCPSMNTEGILFVDDERSSHRYFVRAFENAYPVHCAACAEEALRIMHTQNDIAVVVSDHRMAGTNGIDLLEEIGRKFPKVIRILTTAYTEVGLLIAAINRGIAFAFIAKPWDLPSLVETVKRGHHAYREKKTPSPDDVTETRIIGTVASELSHYLNNTLFPISLYLDQIEGAHSGSVDSQTPFSNHPPSRHLRQHLRQLSEFLENMARIETFCKDSLMETFDPGEWFGNLSKVWEPMFSQRGISFTSAVAPNLRVFTADRQKLTTLLRLLFAEALASLTKGALLHLSLLQSSDTLSIVMEDNIPLRGDRPKTDYLKPFQARSGNPKDPAVFLHCAQRIVNSCGGWTSVGPGSLDGTRFTFTIPESKNDCCREAAVPCLPEERLTDTIVQ